MDLAHVRTPALLVDPARLDRNIAAMAHRAQASAVDLRPHFKTHKSVRIAQRQLAAGAVGLTVATVREAEALADAGATSVMVAQPPVGAWRIERLLDVARRVELRVTVDDLDQALNLDRAADAANVQIGVLWEVDPGLGRCGTAPGAATAAAVAAFVAQAVRLEFLGLLTFPGHAYAAADLHGVAAVARQEREAVADTARALAAENLDVPVISCGSTPTARFMGDQPLATEQRPGNYVFNDMTQVRLGVASMDDCALSVLGTVVSRPSPTRVILDSGSKALAAERMSSLTTTFGHVLGHPELRVERLFEEHAILESDTRVNIPVGGRLQVVPNHACTAANLHREMLVVDDGQVIDVWALDARGWDS